MRVNARRIVAYYALTNTTTRIHFDNANWFSANETPEQIDRLITQVGGEFA